MDKISAVEYQKLFSLIEVIYTHAVFTEIERLCEENCCGCKIDHPSQRQHDCLMLTAEEKWELYYKKAVALLNDNRSVWDEFIEATRVLKLSCHEDVLERLRATPCKNRILSFIRRKPDWLKISQINRQGEILVL